MDRETLIQALIREVPGVDRWFASVLVEAHLKEVHVGKEDADLGAEIRTQPDTGGVDMAADPPADDQVAGGEAPGDEHA